MTTQAATARRIHFLFLAVSDDVRREVKFSPLPSGEVEVYCFDGEEGGDEARGTFTAEQARVLWASFTAGGYVWTRSFIVWPEAAPVAAAVEPAPAPVAPAPAPKPAAPSFESEECSRCHGTGKHSRCQMYGDTCFRCAGKGRTLTARGEAAQAHLRTLRSKRLDAIQPGDVVYHRGGGPIAASWETVGEGWVAARLSSGWKADEMIRVRQSREQSIATWDAALAYQATLTKAGTVRRARVAVAA